MTTDPNNIEANIDAYIDELAAMGLDGVPGRCFDLTHEIHNVVVTATDQYHSDYNPDIPGHARVEIHIFGGPRLIKETGRPCAGSWVFTPEQAMRFGQILLGSAERAACGPDAAIWKTTTE